VTLHSLEEELSNFDSKIAGLPGWLHPATAYATVFLLDWQSQLGMKGNLLEIGVYGGKYLALMSRFAGDGDIAYGVDPFYLEGTSADKVMADLRAIGCDKNVEIIVSRSDTISHQDFAERFGRVRFFHIDGSHKCEDVLGDLAIADHLLAEDGVLSYDDFLNPYWMGVTEAFFLYFERNPRSDLVPFAYCRNKLFLCRAPFVETWDGAFADFIAELGDRLTITKLNPTTSIHGRRIPALFW
jgi:hypothetical protein